MVWTFYLRTHPFFWRCVHHLLRLAYCVWPQGGIDRAWSPGRYMQDHFVWTLGKVSYSFLCNPILMICAHTAVWNCLLLFCCIIYECIICKVIVTKSACASNAYLLSLEQLLVWVGVVQPEKVYCEKWSTNTAAYLYRCVVNSSLTAQLTLVC